MCKLFDHVLDLRLQVQQKSKYRLMCTGLLYGKKKTECCIPQMLASKDYYLISGCKIDRTKPVSEPISIFR